ncbi:MBL fold metallo-hydrolase [Candidatus Kaiserbacteria bacterium]|nr:MBL fold metallo-hydrolase [Candidatus Kaiserbacteria bacterium]
MVITYHGGQCFKVTFGDLTLVFDPVSKASSLPAVRFGADIALVSRNHPDFNGVDEVTYGDKKPFAITGPGEYEHGGVTIQGFLSSSKYGLAKGEESAVNTIYSVNLEDMTLVHFGALSDKELSKEAREGMGEIDILFVPVGGEGVLSVGDAHALTLALEPKVIIPMHYDPKSLAAFLKQEGETPETTDKLTLKKKDVATRDGAILVIKP